jgi:hypothetical protein
MKFILLVTAAVLVAGGGTFLLTGQQAVAPKQSLLAGDWRCNQTIDGVSSALLMSVAGDGGVRGLVLMRVEEQGYWVSLEARHTGSLRVEGNQLHETLANVQITEAEVDGEQAPASVKAQIRQSIETGSATRRLKELSETRLVYDTAGGETLCERSPVPLNL